ncbi:MAG TPA: VOC family protein [Anaerolineae bacterium]|nr:VOC family protein [Anaerolineae bacterium]
MSSFTLPPTTHIGTLTLTVRDLNRQIQFYTTIIGLTLLNQTPTNATLGSPTKPLINLHANPQAQRHQPATGLFHLAILLPTRSHLAHWLFHFLSLGYQLPGAADHGVSEALYLNDPEGNGIEIYRDRPRHQWPMNGQHIAMVSERLDFNNLLADRPSQPFTTLPDKTTLGHIHLMVNNLTTNLNFYTQTLGFTLMQGNYPGAKFIAAGGYHHHLGLNTWHSANAPAPPADALGLHHYTIRLPHQTALDQLTTHLATQDLNPHDLTDPAGNRLQFTL